MVRCLGLGLDFDGINYIMGSQLGKLCINVAQYTGVFWKILCRYFGERHINDAKLPCVDMLSRNPCFPLEKTRGWVTTIRKQRHKTFVLGKSVS